MLIVVEVYAETSQWMVVQLINYNDEDHFFDYRYMLGGITLEVRKAG